MTHIQAHGKEKDLMAGIKYTPDEVEEVEGDLESTEESVVKMDQGDIFKKKDAIYLEITPIAPIAAPAPPKVKKKRTKRNP